MQGAKSIEGLSFTRLEHNFTCKAYVKVNNMDDLRLLSVRNCENVGALFNIMRHTMNLRGLMIHFSTEHNDLSMQKFIKIIGNVAHDHLQQLRVLQIHNMKHLKCFSYDFPNLICLQDVSIIECETLEELPKGFGQLEALEAFRILRCPNLKKDT